MSLRRRTELPQVFGMSLMDTVCCGIGASILMMLLFVALVRPGAPVVSQCVDCKQQTAGNVKDKPIFTLIVEVNGLEESQRLVWAPKTILPSDKPGEIRYSSSYAPNLINKTSKFTNQRLWSQFRLPDKELNGKSVPTVESDLPAEDIVFELDFGQNGWQNANIWVKVITEVNALSCSVTASQLTQFTMKRYVNSYKLEGCQN